VSETPEIVAQYDEVDFQGERAFVREISTDGKVSLLTSSGMKTAKVEDLREINEEQQ